MTRFLIIPALCEIQDRHGYLPAEELQFLALRADVPLYRLQELASFFPHFHLKPPPPLQVSICRSMSCHLRGSDQLLEQANRKFAKEREAGKIAIEGVSCLGRCDQATTVCLHRHSHVGGGHGAERYLGGFTPERHGSDLLQRISDALAGKIGDAATSTPPPPALWQMDVYDPRHGGERPPPYHAARNMLVDPEGPPHTEGILDALKTAGLVGMGGAAARTWKKWQDVRDARGDTKYIVCNGDESEPGTFKDREILLHAPHLVLEGMLIAGLLLGAERGYLYIRHEYHEQIDAVKRCLQRLGTEHPDLMARCPLEVFVSPGLYICGEESALLEVIEGRRAQPRNTPPEIRTNGLFEKPTLVNNVETFAWVPAILLREKGSWYQKTGLRFFSVSGDVRHPGVHEVPISMTLRQLLEDRCGGMAEGRELRAIAPSGPSGGFLPSRLKADDLRAALDRNLPGLRDRGPTEAERVERFRTRALANGDAFLNILDLELDVALFRALELSLGAGIVVYGAAPGSADGMLEHARNCLEFFAKESCGKCVPCRLGSQQLVGFAGELRPTAMNPSEHAQVETTVRSLAVVMETTSICGLGRVASNPLTTYLEYFGNELLPRETTKRDTP